MIFFLFQLLENFDFLVTLSPMTRQISVKIIIIVHICTIYGYRWMYIESCARLKSLRWFFSCSQSQSQWILIHMIKPSRPRTFFQFFIDLLNVCDLEIECVPVFRWVLLVMELRFLCSLFNLTVCVPVHSVLCMQYNLHVCMYVKCI